MKLEKQVTSLELSKKLKALGIKQESLFYWVNGILDRKNDNSTITQLNWDNQHLATKHQIFSAFTVTELGEILPSFIDLEGHNRVFNCWKEPQGWQCAYCFHSGPGDAYLKEAEIEADARASMLIYLKENKLI